MVFNGERQYGVIEYYPGFRYAGEVKDSKANGYGVDFNSKGVAIFSGQHVNDKIVGLGKFLFKDGHFTGRVNEDGSCLGRIEYKGGHIYEGHVNHNKPHGKGIIKSPDGEVYIGNFFEGLKSDFGILSCKEGTLKGYWREGCTTLRYDNFWIITPICPLNPPSLDHYSGETKNDLPDGKGKYILPNCNFYDGAWKRGKCHGKGKLFLRKENMTYEGDFNDGKIEGIGTILKDARSYTGELKDGLPHGQGVLVHYSTRYEGIFDKGLPVQGKMNCTNKNEYEGAWKNGKPAISIFNNLD